MYLRKSFILFYVAFTTLTTLHGVTRQQQTLLPQEVYLPGQNDKSGEITDNLQPSNSLRSNGNFQRKRNFLNDVSLPILNKMKVGDPSPVLLLSIDGAAVRGPYQLKIIRALSQKLNRPVHEIFDVFVGTSAGASNVAGLTTPAKNQIQYTNTGIPGLQARYPLDTLLHYGDLIISRTFDQNKIRKLRVLGGLLGSQFSSKPMAEILQHVTEGTNMADTLKPVVITSHDFLERETYLFSTRKACNDPRQDLPLWMAALASGSAPVYFKTFPVNIMGREMALGDAGLYIMNPSLLGYVEARILYPNRKIYIISISSGDLVPQAKRRKMRLKGATAGNIPSVLQGTIETCVEGSQFAADEIVKEMKMFPEIVEYRRLGFRVENSDFSDTSPKNKALLEQAVEDTIQSKEFEEVIRELKTILALRDQQNDTPVYKCPLKMRGGLAKLRSQNQPLVRQQSNRPY